jgi:hypothetical protein
VPGGSGVPGCWGKGAEVSAGNRRSFHYFLDPGTPDFDALLPSVGKSPQ